MNMIIAGVGTQPCMFDCYKAAKARSGCDVILVNTKSNVVPGSIHYTIDKLGNIPKSIFEWNLMFQVRWIMAAKAIKDLGLSGPFYIPDWDIMVFHDVTQHIEAMSGFGMLYTMDNGHCGSAAHVVRNLDILNAYIEYLFASATEATKMWQLSDMYTWHMFCQSNSIPIANLSEEFCGGVFDHNIHTGGDVWETDNDGRKRIEWHSCKPYFVRKHDKKRIKAEAIHCWATYKNKTKEMIAHAGME